MKLIVHLLDIAQPGRCQDRAEDVASRLAKCDGFAIGTTCRNPVALKKVGIARSPVHIAAQRVIVERQIFQRDPRLRNRLWLMTRQCQRRSGSGNLSRLACDSFSSSAWALPPLALPSAA